MGWYSEASGQSIPDASRSLVVGFANLLQKLGHEKGPDELYGLLTSEDPEIDWWSLAEYIDELDIKEVSDREGWPQTSTAIVRFSRIAYEGTPPVDHYCLVADHRAHIIIDSLDGRIKSASLYGTPTGWASYMQVEPDPELDRIEAEARAKTASSPRSLYILSAGETLWTAARKLNLSVEALMTHNAIEDPRVVKEGYLLRIPEPKVERKQTIEIELLDEPTPMHVTKASGTRKCRFNNVKKWHDITPAGPGYPNGANVDIVAVAHVPIPETGEVAAFYMDKLALGDYATTGRVQYTIGFNHSHLADGHVDRILVVKENLGPPPAELIVVPPVEVEPPKVEIIVPEPVIEVPAPQTPIPALPPASNSSRTMDFGPPKRLPITDDLTRLPIPQLYIAEDSITVHELHRRRPAKTLLRNQAVNIAATVMHDGELHGIPDGYERSGFLFVIPMSKLILEDELYNYDVPLSQRVAIRGTLTSSERYWFIPFARSVSVYTRIATLLNKNRKTINKD